MITEVDLSGTPCFAPDAKLTGLKKINFIFGPNGAGKTTLTRELGRLNSDNQATHIYNRDYLSEIFYLEPTGIQGEIPGITFTIGSENTELQKKRKETLKKLADLNNLLQTLRKTQSKQQKQADEDRKALKSKLKKAWEPYAASNELLSGLKRDVHKLVERLQREREESEIEESLASLDNRYQTISNNQLSKIQLPDFTSTMQQLKDTDIKRALEKSIDIESSSSLFPFASQYNLLPWIKEGLDLIKQEDIDNHTCPYCQQDIDDRLLEQIATLFNKSASDSFQELETLKEIVRQSATTLKEISSLITDSILHSENNIRDAISTIDKQVSTLRETWRLIQEKQRNSDFKPPKDFEYIDIQKLDKALSIIYKRTIKNNEECSNTHQAKQNITHLFFARLHQDNQEIIKEYYIKRPKGTQSALSNISMKITKTKSEIQTKEQELREISDQLGDQTAVRDKINSTLCDLGFISFRLGQAPNSKKHYTIERPVRDNPSSYTPSPFSTLSEGEKTILSFLYFIHCINPHAKQPNDSTPISLIIDDPIASTDDSTFNFISTLIRRLLRALRNPKKQELQQLLSSKVTQIIILTHNIGFYTNTSFEIRSGYNQDQPPNDLAFYRITKSIERGTPNSIHRVRNPKEISTEYQLLWNEIHDAATSCRNHEPNETIPRYRLIANTMRRILDSYFITLGSTNFHKKEKSPKSSITELGRSYGPMVEECMNRFNEGSHGSYANFACSTMPTRQELMKFEEIFSKHIDHGAHHGHFLMMMGLPSGGQISDLWEEGQEGDKALVD